MLISGNQSKLREWAKHKSSFKSKAASRFKARRRKNTLKAWQSDQHQHHRPTDYYLGKRPQCSGRRMNGTPVITGNTQRYKHELFWPIYKPLCYMKLRLIRFKSIIYETL